jgi:chromosomal replication initiation ATPase DnaA
MPAVTRSSTSSARQLRLDLSRRPSYAREDFVVAESNAAAVAALDAWPQWPGGKLALVGPPGSGKTHLGRDWAARAGAVIVEAKAGAAPPATGPILFDDADRRNSDDLLFHLINRADSGASLLITGRTAPAGWTTRLPDLASRLRALTVARIEPPDDAVLTGVMLKLFSERNIKPSAGVPSYLVQRIERSATALRRMVARIDERAGGENREVTLALVREVLQGEDAAPREP